MKLRSRDLSDAKLVPPQPLSCDNGRGDHAHSPSNRQLYVPAPAVATKTGCYSRFKLPDDGWIVKKVPRRYGPTIDKYYYEEGSGTTFRSLKEVERYIKTGEYPSKSSAVISRCYFKHPSYAKKHIKRGSKVRKLDEEKFHKKQRQIVNSTANVRISITNLPDGWVIEEVPRRSQGGSYKHYYEPGTGRKFRSLLGVLRHLEEEIPLSAYIEQIKENAPLSKAFKLHRKLKNASRKRNSTGTNGDGYTSSFVSPPKKIKWILGSTGGDVWYPFIFETPVHDSVKQEWNERFTVVMKDDDNQHQRNEIL